MTIFHFSNASSTIYGRKGSLCQVSREDQICSSLLLGKSEVSVTKYGTIKFEMTTGKFSTNMSQLVKKLLELKNERIMREHL